MNVRQRIKQISEAMKKMGHSGSAYQIANLLGVSQSTISRWINSRQEYIRSRHISKALSTLEKITEKAICGSQNAKDTLNGHFDKTKTTIAEQLEAAVMVVGMAWLFKDEPATEDTDKKETHPHQSKPKAQQRTSQRRKSTPRS